MKKRWIITGANGYLGKHLYNRLISEGKKVVGLARKGRSLEVLKNAEIPFAEYSALPDILQENDVFVHCAAKTGNCGNWEEYYRINILWTLELFKEALKSNIHSFIYISSIAAMGYKTRHKQILDEKSASIFTGAEFYGKSKYEAENELLKNATGAGTKLLILRPGLIFGPKIKKTKQSFLRRGLEYCKNQRLPLINIDNFCDALFIAEKKGKDKEIYVAVDQEQPSIKYFNNLKVINGINKYPPFYIGRKGFVLLYFIRFVKSLIKRRGLTKDSIVALYVMKTRGNIYSNSKIKDIGWTQRKTLIECMEESAGEI